VHLKGAFRTIFLHPLSISFIVTGLTWQWVLSPTIGFHAEVGVKLVEHLAGIGKRRKTGQVTRVPTYRRPIPY
jgi:ABC-type sugar transport system permease subunit